MAPRKRRHDSTPQSSTAGGDGIKLSDSLMSSFDIFAKNFYAPIEGDEKAEELSIRSKVCAQLLYNVQVYFHFNSCMHTFICRYMTNIHSWMNMYRRKECQRQQGDNRRRLERLVKQTHLSLHELSIL